MVVEKVSLHIYFVQNLATWAVDRDNMRWATGGESSKTRVSKEEYDKLVKKKNCGRHSNDDDYQISQYLVQDMLFRTRDGQVIMFEDATIFDGNVNDWYIYMTREVCHGDTWTAKGMNSMDHCFNLKYLRRNWMKVPFFHGNDRMAYALKIAAEMNQSTQQEMGNKSTEKTPLVNRLTYLHDMMLSGTGRLS